MSSEEENWESGEGRRAYETMRPIKLYQLLLLGYLCINNHTCVVSFYAQSSLNNVTVLFSDIRGFTSMSEQMTPQEVSKILNEYFTEIG